MSRIISGSIFSVSELVVPCFVILCLQPLFSVRGAFELSLGGMTKMSERRGLATPRQLACIERLAAECRATIWRPLGELSADEASKIIRDLLVRVNGGIGDGRENLLRTGRGFGAGVRFSLAFMVCYQRWVRSGSNVFSHREQFVENVLATLSLVDEVAEKAGFG
jgi:hypothetical protein